MVVEVFGNGPGVYLPPQAPVVTVEERKEERKLNSIKSQRVVTKKMDNIGNTNNNNIYGGRLSVDSLNPRHRSCFLEGPEYPRSAFGRLGTTGNVLSFSLF